MGVQLSMSLFLPLQASLSRARNHGPERICNEDVRCYLTSMQEWDT